MDQVGIIFIHFDILYSFFEIQKREHEFNRFQILSEGDIDISSPLDKGKLIDSNGRIKNGIRLLLEENQLVSKWIILYKVGFEQYANLHKRVYPA